MSLLSYFDQFNASLMNKSIHFFKKQSYWSQKLNADCSLLTLLVKFMYGISVETFNSVSSWCLWLCVLGQRSCECLSWCLSYTAANIVCLCSGQTSVSRSVLVVIKISFRSVNSILLSFQIWEAQMCFYFLTISSLFLCIVFFTKHIVSKHIYIRI